MERLFFKKINRYINEIIEFGAVKLDEDLNEIGRFSILVRPELTKKLRTAVKNLTSITNEELRHGSPFSYALSKFSKFCKGCVVMSWSTSDLIALQDNSLYHQRTTRLPFIKNYIDIQAYCQDMLGITDKKAIGLVPAAEILGLNVDDIPHHRAVGDCLVAAKCLKEIYSKPMLLSYMQKADCDEFYDKLNFHNTYISNLEKLPIDTGIMFMNCNMCGARAVQLTDWEKKNVSFYSDFECPECHNKFKGKMQFRVRYEGIIPVKKIVTREEASKTGESDEQDSSPVEE